MLLPFVAGCSEDSSTGDPNTENKGSWAGHTYLLNIPGSRWSAPTGASEELGAYVPKFLFQVNTDSAGSAEILIGTSTDIAGTQDLCNPTTIVTATTNYPSMHIPPTDVPVHIVDAVTQNAIVGKAYGLTVSDIFPDGTTPATAGTFAATVDARELYPLFRLLENPTADSVCAALSSVGATCGACPSDGAAYCLDLKAQNTGAVEIAGVSVQPIATTDLAATCVAIPAPTEG